MAGPAFREHWGAVNLGGCGWPGRTTSVAAVLLPKPSLAAENPYAVFAVAISSFWISISIVNFPAWPPCTFNGSACTAGLAAGDDVARAARRLPGLLVDRSAAEEVDRRRGTRRARKEEKETRRKAEA